MGNDISLEQLYTCSQNGFSEFLEPQWLSKVLSEQDHHGCFKDGVNYRHGRHLLSKYDEETPNGCSLHKSSVALCTLSMFLEKEMEKYSSDSSLIAA